MNQKYHRRMTRGLDGVAESLASLGGFEIEVEVDEEPLVGMAAMDTLAASDWFMECRLLANHDVMCGLIIDDIFTRKVSAAMLMVPGLPEEMTEELHLAFDEALNIAIGCWNRTCLKEENHWDNGVDGRKVGQATGPWMGRMMDTGIGLAMASLKVEGETYRIGIFGSVGWMDPNSEIREVEVAPAVFEEPKEDNLGPAPVAPSPPPQVPKADVNPLPPPPAGFERSGDQPGRSGSLGGAHDMVPAPASHYSNQELIKQLMLSTEPDAKVAQVMLVDLTGAFARWLGSQLDDPDVTIRKITTGIDGDVDCGAVVLINPNVLKLATMRAENTLVMRKTS